MHHTVFRLLVFLLAPVVFCPVACAQATGVEMLTTRDGLSQGYISCILQDSEGFIWAGTKNGLNRYDGYRFSVFTNDPYDEHSLSNDFITSLNEFGAFLVVGTANSGLNIFHKNTRFVYRFPNNLLVPGATDVNIRWAAADAGGNIWATYFVPNQPTFLCKITLPPGFWQAPGKNPEWWKSAQVQRWTGREINGTPFLSTDKKNLTVFASDTVFQIDMHLDTWSERLATFPARAVSVHGDAHDNLWFSWQIDGKRELLRLKQGISPAKKADLEHIPMMGPFERVLELTGNYIWLQFADEVRTFQLDPNGNFDSSRPYDTGLPLRRVYFTDRSGLQWIGTDGLGILKVNSRSKHFRHLFAGHSISQPILEDRQGNIFAYSSNFEHLYEPATPPPPAASVLPVLKELTESRIMQDPNDRYWVLGGSKTDKLLLEQLDPSGNRRSFLLNESPYWKNAMTLDAEGHPWIGINGHLLHFDPVAGQFLTNDFKPVLPEPHTVFALAQAPGNIWWIATNKGLLQAKPSAQGFDFQLFKNDPANRNSLRNNIVLSLLIDPGNPGILWIGTNGGGLDRLDIQSGQFTHLSTREGLPNDVIYAILPESGGGRNNLWLSSNKGLIRYTPADGRIKNYTEADGVQADEFNTWAYGKGMDGTLMFGGVNGITMFKPADLQENTVIPQVHIIEVRLNDKPVSLGGKGDLMTQAVEFTRTIVVPFSQNNITLEFVALDYSVPAKNRFRYYLEGAEKEWAHESSDHRAGYLNLPPGTYTFKVKGCNSDGVWNDKAAELEITVLPPWYRSAWAYLLYIALAGGGIYYFYRYQLRRKLEQAENQRLIELDAFKSRFFTNVTHEFRTPLTVILGMTDRLGNDKILADASQKKSALELIRRNGANLLRLINEILDLAKLESNTLNINYIQGDVLAYVRYISESLHSLANVKNVLLRVESEQSKIVMDYDPERILQIVYNLLSNAIKFTPSGGRVTLRADLIPSKSLPNLRIQVSDTGAGIPPEDLQQIFERFYQGKNQAQNKAGGTGIGLSLTRELVKALGGEISVESTPGKSTVFTVHLPATNHAPSGNEIRDYQTNSTSLTPNVAYSQSTILSSNGELPQLLIIEDNPDVVEYLAGCLNGLYQLDFAYNGHAGIEKALETVPDLIISDVMMPEKDGFEVCNTLKNDERSSHIPIVLLTARATVEDRIKGLRRGADAYLAKPFHPDELLANLANLLLLRERLRARYGAIALQPPPPTEDQSLQIEDVFLQKLRALVDKHLSDTGFEMPQMERALAMSRSQIFRKVKALTGTSPTLFIRSIRLEKARELLQNSSLTVSEIAYETGFSSPQYFSDAFLEAFGVRPSATRN